MSQENVEIARRIYEAVSAGKVPAAELFLPDAGFNATGASPDLGSSQGLTDAEVALRSYAETFEDYHVELVEVIHADDGRVVTEVRDGGRMTGSDAEVWNRFFHVFTFRGNKIASWSTHTDRAAALKAAGLSD